MIDVKKYLTESAVVNPKDIAKEMLKTIESNFDLIFESEILDALDQIVKECGSKDVEDAEEALSKLRAIFKATNDIVKVLELGESDA